MKKILAFFVAMILTLPIILTACGQPPKLPVINITSGESVTLGLGEKHQIIFDVTNASALKVIASKDVFDEDTNIFCSNLPGTFPINLIATNKNGKTDKKISIKVTEASFTELDKAIAAAEALDSVDYTIFTAVTVALRNAVAVRDDPQSQEEVDEKVTMLNDAIASLIKKDIVKATISDSAVIYGGKTYLLNTFKDVAALTEAINALNSNEAITTVRQYNLEFNNIIAKYASIDLAISGVAAGEHYAVGSKVTLAAVASANGDEFTGIKSYEWKIDGEYASDKNVLDMTVESGKEYTVTLKIVTENNVEATQTVVFTRNIMNAKAGTGGFATVNNQAGIITLTGDNMDWTPYDKSYVDYELTGDFAVEFDMVSTIGNSIPAVHMLKADGSYAGVSAVRNDQANRISMEVNDTSKPGADYKIGATNKRYRIERKVSGADSIYTFSIVEDGGVSVVNRHAGYNGGIKLAFSTALSNTTTYSNIVVEKSIKENYFIVDNLSGEFEYKFDLVPQDINTKVSIYFFDETRLVGQGNINYNFSEGTVGAVELGGDGWDAWQDNKLAGFPNKANAAEGNVTLTSFKITRTLHENNTLSQIKLLVLDADGNIFKWKDDSKSESTRNTFTGGTLKIMFVFSDSTTIETIA